MSATATPPGLLSFDVDESLYSLESSEWFCTIDEHDTRCLRVTNRRGMQLPVPRDDRCVCVCKVDSGVRVAVPRGYAVLVARLRSSKVAAETGGTLPCVTNGVVDSGYRGTIGFVLYYDAASSVIPRGGLTVRLALVRLADVRPGARMLFDLYDAGDEYECGAQFVYSVRAAADSGALEAEPRGPPDGSETWEGTGCGALACLYDYGARCASQYEASDPDVAFAVLARGAVVVGLRRPPTPGAPAPRLRFGTSGGFAVLVPFWDTFAEKRDEDAGYDVYAPASVVVPPMSTATLVVRQRYVCRGGAVVPCLLGRSSMNARGLAVSPCRWTSDSWLYVDLHNFTHEEARVEAGDRIAQLLLVSREAPLWLPCGRNLRDPFPAPEDVRVDRESVCPAPRWRRVVEFDEEAPPSLRAAGGFGSTGR